MFKMKKLAAVAAAAVMAASAMASSASAVTVETGNINEASGTYCGKLTIENYSNRKQVDAITRTVYGSFSTLGAVLIIFDGTTGQQLYYDDQTNDNYPSFASASAYSGNLATVSADSHHIATSGSQVWSTMLSLRG